MPASGSLCGFRHWEPLAFVCDCFIAYSHQLARAAVFCRCGSSDAENGKRDQELVYNAEVKLNLPTLCRHRHAGRLCIALEQHAHRWLDATEDVLANCDVITVGIAVF